MTITHRFLFFFKQLCWFYKVNLFATWKVDFFMICISINLFSFNDTKAFYFGSILLFYSFIVYFLCCSPKSGSSNFLLVKCNFTDNNVKMLSVFSMWPICGCLFTAGIGGICFWPLINAFTKYAEKCSAFLQNIVPWLSCLFKGR